MDNKPQIPTLKDTQQQQKKDTKPLLKIKGLSGGGQSLIERLKQFKKKDLAFILAGLGVLFMAPLAEHFMMSPEDGGGKFKEGFNKRDGVFGHGDSPWENGVTGLAPGGMVGGGSDVITPLNVRDPSALVMGPGATQQAPAGAPQQPAVAPPPIKEDSKWNDAIAAGKAAAGAATRRASLPVPRVPLSAGGLRGLSAASGGTGANFNLGAPSAANVPNKPGAQNSGLNKVKGSIKGVASGPGSGGNAGNLENLKKNAAGAANDFNRGGAGSGLESAYNRDMGSGRDGSGAGQGGSGDDKGTAGSSNKDSKSPGESLDFLRMKQEQEKAIDLKWKLKEKQAMMWPNLKEKLLEEALMTPFKAITKGIAGVIEEAGSSPDATSVCTRDTGGAPIQKVPACSLKTEDNKTAYCTRGNKMYKQQGSEEVGGYTCFGGKGGDPKDSSGPDMKDKAPGTGDRKDPMDRRSSPQMLPQSNVGQSCQTLDGSLNKTDVPAGAKADDNSAWVTPYQETRSVAGRLSGVEQLLTGNRQNSSRCRVNPEGTPVTTMLSDSRNKLVAALEKLKEVADADGKVQDAALLGKEGKGLIDKGVDDLSKQVEQANPAANPKKLITADTADVANMNLRKGDLPIVGYLTTADEKAKSRALHEGIWEARDLIGKAETQLTNLDRELDGMKSSPGMTSQIKDKDYQKWYGGRLAGIRGAMGSDMSAFKKSIFEFQNDVRNQQRALKSIEDNLQEPNGRFYALRAATEQSITHTGEINKAKTNPKFFQEDVVAFVADANQKLTAPGAKLEEVKPQLTETLRTVRANGRAVHLYIKDGLAPEFSKLVETAYRDLGVNDGAGGAPSPAAPSAPAAPTTAPAAAQR